MMNAHNACQLASRRQTSRGFTLIEVMVTLAIVAVAFSMVTLGFNQIFAKQLDAEGEKLSDWMAMVAETAVFRSTVLGVQREEKVLNVVAFYDNRWFKLNGVESYTLPDEYDWSVEVEERLDFGQDLANENREPFVAFLPSGRAMPQGELSVFADDQDAVTLVWEENTNIELVFGLDDRAKK